LQQGSGKTAQTGMALLIDIGDAGAHITQSGVSYEFCCVILGGCRHGHQQQAQGGVARQMVAGLVGSCVFAALSALAMHFTLLGSFPLWHLLLLGAAGGALGQLGDLMESLYKRSTGNKDSGSLIPGHGGLLDRIDALLVVGPLIYLYALWCVPAVSMP
jgi:hypothetical protein